MKLFGGKDNDTGMHKVDNRTISVEMNCDEQGKSNNEKSLILFLLCSSSPGTLSCSLHVLQQVLEACVCLLAARQNLVCREDKAISTRVSELRRKGVIRLDHVAHIVNAGAGGLIDSRADRAVIKRGAVDCTNGSNGALGE